MKLPGIAEEWTRRVPDEVQERLPRTFYPNELRVIWNPVTRGWTVVRRDRSVWSDWWDGQILDGWAIICHYDGPLRGLGDSDRLCAEIGSMFRLDDFASPEQAADHIERMWDEHEAKAEQASDQRIDDFVESEYPKDYLQEQAFNRDCERRYEKEMDEASGKRHLVRDKSVVAAGGGV